MAMAHATLTGKEIDNNNANINIAILPSPGVGHLNPLLEFVKRLFEVEPERSRRLSISFILIPASPSQSPVYEAKKKSLVSSLPPDAQVDFFSLPYPKFDKEGFSSMKEEIISRVVLTSHRSLPSLRSLLADLTKKNKPFSAIIVDMFGTPAFDVAASEFGIDPYIFFPSSATTLSMFMYLPKLDQMVPSEVQFWEMAEPVRIPGFRVPVRGRDLLNLTMDRKAKYYSEFIEQTKRYRSAKGILVNTFESLEPGVITTFKNGSEQRHYSPLAPVEVYPVGPITKKLVSSSTTVEEDDDHENDQNKHCLKWLDQQPPGSVLYVNFGSGGTLSTAQVDELALGLEESGERFLWVVRVPDDGFSFAAFLGVEKDRDPLSFLPQGFLERTKDRGLVVPFWAPQTKILAHKSTGGFLTHCGWNSILEAVNNGVPFITWPLFAEQRINAAFLADDLGVAVKVDPDEDKLDKDNGPVGRQVIASAVRALMVDEQGKEIARKMKECRDEAAKAVGIDGTSTIAIRQFVTQLFKV